jgi:hypothetical protein
MMIAGCSAEAELPCEKGNVMACGVLQDREKKEGEECCSEDL